MAATVILGAGDLGGALARQLAAANVVSSITLVDQVESVAQGKALDIRQAAPVDRYTAVITGTASLDAVIGAGVIVLADTASGSTEWPEDAAMGLVGRVAALNSDAAIVCAGSTQAPVIERAVRDLGLARLRIFGTAPEALRAAVMSMAALEAGCAAPDVSLSVLGCPPHQIIVPWEDAAIAGRRATSVLSPPALGRLDRRLPHLWPPGPLTLASAATRAIVAALSRSARTITVFVSITREQGAAGRVGMLPALVTARGIASVMKPELSSRDRVRLETALAAG